MLELISAALDVNVSMSCLERMYVAYNAKCNRLGNYMHFYHFQSIATGCSMRLEMYSLPNTPTSS